MNFSYSRNVLKENIVGIDNGLSTPNPDLLIFLIISWTLVFFITFKGIKSSGKASYLFVILPYFILGVLLVRSLTLPGALNGIIFFLKPRWEEMLKAKVSDTFVANKKFNYRLFTGLVFSCYPSIFFFVRLFWRHHHVCVIQQIQSQHLQRCYNNNFPGYLHITLGW